MVRQQHERGTSPVVDAAGRCPPEDAGGAPKYAEYLDAISDPTHPEHEKSVCGESNNSIPTSSTGRRSRGQRMTGICKPRSRKPRSKQTSSANQKGQSYAYERRPCRRH
ncbi:hypothetical protein QA639_34970 [Bradyrhizobium pachyrhizi]|nr:hypothetical protein [Bradyrhizobium pachyrhizi]WFU54741.1 hypothetical protein QA639_34970 [Bradyrhizobium pachyrhizi]